MHPKLFAKSSAFASECRLKQIARANNLYSLDYLEKKMAHPTGFEPVTFGIGRQT